MRAALALALALVAFARTAAADDTWSDPFPGVRFLHRALPDQQIFVAVMDLCRGGIAARATLPAEGRQTVPRFAAAVGAQLAVNANFYDPADWTRIDGPVVGNGTRWGGPDHDYVGQIAFGLNRAEIVHHAVVREPEPWMTQLVSGHPSVVIAGELPDNSGDTTLCPRNPRTAVGLSRDRRTLYVAVVDGRAAGRAGMTCNELGVFLRDLGAWDALNLDGGGSAVFWMQGAGVVNRPSDGSLRLAATHLAFTAPGGFANPAHCPTRLPAGTLDGATCEAVAGWAQDPDVPAEARDVLLSFGGPVFTPGAVAHRVHAEFGRADLCAALGSCTQAFSVPVPLALRDGVDRAVHAYAFDNLSGQGVELAASPRRVRCATPSPPAGVRRHVVDEASWTAWDFQHPGDDLALPPAVVAAAPEGSPLPAAPDLVRAADGPAVYLLDRGHRRHVRDATSFAHWRFLAARVRIVSAAEIAALPEGRPWPAEPFFARASGSPVVYAWDDPDGLDAPLDASAPADVTTPVDAARDAVRADAPTVDVARDADDALDLRPAPSEGCGCRAGAPRSAPWGLAAIAAMLVVRRRRTMGLTRRAD